MNQHRERAGLIVVDVQRGFDDPRWGPRNNPACESNIEALVQTWVERQNPVVLIRHDSLEPHSPLAPGSPGNEFKEAITQVPDLLVTKNVHSAFHGTPDLHQWLTDRELSNIAICGITTNHCCETTARVGADLGYDVSFIFDATHTFDMKTPDGQVITADELARATAASLNGEFARVVSTQEFLG